MVASLEHPSTEIVQECREKTTKLSTTTHMTPNNALVWILTFEPKCLSSLTRVYGRTYDLAMRRNFGKAKRKLKGIQKDVLWNFLLRIGVNINWVIIKFDEPSLK